MAKPIRKGAEEARSQLPELLTAAQQGRQTIITRHGRPVVKLTPIAPPPKPLTPDALDLLARQRVGRRMPRDNAVAAVRKLRDEWTR